MANSSFSSLLSAAPLPDPPQVDIRKDLYQYQLERDRYDRAMHDYIRRLMQAINGPNIVNELILTQQITNILNNVLTTKGDLMTHTGSATVRQGVGTNGQVLTADSGVTNGVKWATPSTGTAGSVSSSKDLGGAVQTTTSSSSNVEYHSTTFSINMSNYNTVGAGFIIRMTGEIIAQNGSSSWTHRFDLTKDPTGTPAIWVTSQAVTDAFANNFRWWTDWIFITGTTGASGKLQCMKKALYIEDAVTPTIKQVMAYEELSLDMTASYTLGLGNYATRSGGTATYLQNTVRHCFVNTLA